MFDVILSKIDFFSFYEKLKKIFYLVNVMVYSFRVFYYVEMIYRYVIFDFINLKNVFFENYDKLFFVIILYLKIFKWFNLYLKIFD